MKRILITGANSYIGTAFRKYLQDRPDDYQVDAISVRGEDWKKTNFSGYDAVVHVAGIAHSDLGRISSEKEKLYYAVNTSLTAAVAEKAKMDGVRQFVFMSSAIVYGDSAPIGKRKRITRDTPPSPASCYGDSKLQAENRIRPLGDDDFKVAIVRPPMVYGAGSKGNYPLLAKLACKLPFFPKVDNERSMIYIGNLVEFLRLIVEREEQGVFWPQNDVYCSTSELVKQIAQCHGKKILLIPGLGWALKCLGCFTGLVNKAFGSLSYDMSLSEYPDNYRLVNMENSIRRTEVQ